ncbi:MAG: zinc-binding dehydrogenase [Thermoanaerobaculales bacterium]|nr:zinc-binding dehydrogenase [Thermoanaerobaculales bacterium]
MSDEAATFLEPGACVLRGIFAAEIGATDGCAVVIGAGSMGLLHLLVLRAHMPNLSVIVIDPLEDRCRFALEIGADAACNPSESPGVVRRMTSGLGADAAFDTVGGAEVLLSAMNVLRPGGTLVLFAHAREEEPAGFELNPFFKNEMRLVATYSGSIDEQDQVARMLFAGRIDPSKLITHRLPLERAPEAVGLARSRQALKIMIG